jgi:hypothetical protein
MAKWKDEFVELIGWILILSVSPYQEVPGQFSAWTTVILAEVSRVFFSTCSQMQG